jgi:hypothetical protein
LTDRLLRKSLRSAMRARLLLLCATCLACDSTGIFELPPDAAADAGSVDASPDSGALEAGADAGPADAFARDIGVEDEDAGEVEDAGVMTMPEPPPLRPYSGGTCPVLVAGSTSTTSVNSGFLSAGDSRSFRVLIPRAYDPSLEWPVVFGWHWLNASSRSFVEDAELETAIDEMGFIAVLPDRLEQANGDKAYLFDWPFVETNDAEKELVFFDDLLSCAGEQLSIDRTRVYGIGVSAGALWLTHLMSSDRVDYLAAVESLSGGLGEVAGAWQMQFTPRAYKFPAIVLWGGPNDWLGLSFAAASERLRDELRANGHFVVECTHDAGHAIPPISPPPGSTTRFWSLWRFMLDHPYGIASPYPAAGLPAGFPGWCRL